MSEDSENEAVREETEDKQYVREAVREETEDEVHELLDHEDEENEDDIDPEED